MTRNQPVVLMVEDDPLILIHSRLALEDAGFAVLAVADSDEALRVLDARTDIATLFTDVNIPGRLDGVALAQAARVGRRALGIVITSGQGMIAADRMPAGARFLPKPYTGAQVSRLLHADVPA